MVLGAAHPESGIYFSWLDARVMEEREGMRWCDLREGICVKGSASFDIDRSGVLGVANLDSDIPSNACRGPCCDLTMFWLTC